MQADDKTVIFYNVRRIDFAHCTEDDLQWLQQFYVSTQHQADQADRFKCERYMTIHNFFLIMHDLSREVCYNLRSLQEVGWGWMKGILSCWSCYRNVGVGDCDNSPQDSQLSSKQQNCSEAEIIIIPYILCTLYNIPYILWHSLYINFTFDVRLLDFSNLATAIKYHKCTSFVSDFDGQGQLWNLWQYGSSRWEGKLGYSASENFFNPLF